MREIVQRSFLSLSRISLAMLMVTAVVNFTWAQPETGLLTSDDQVYARVEEEPQYPGGYEALVKYLKRNMKYPKAALRNNIEGTVYVQFVVAKDGSVMDVKTIRGISTECDLEAERVIKTMPPWQPGKLNGKPVYVRYVLPIAFKGNFKKKKK